MEISESNNINSKKCQNHSDVEAVYMFSKKGTPELFYLCLECQDCFDGNMNEYQITEISNQNIENLKEYIIRVQEELKKKKKTISTFIANREKDFKKMVEKVKTSLIELVELSAKKYFESFKGFEASKFITNLDGYLSQADMLMKTLTDQGNGFDNECLMVRSYVQSNIEIMEEFTKKKFETDKAFFQNWKLSENQVVKEDLLLTNSKHVESIFEKEFCQITEILNGQQINFEFSILPSNVVQSLALGHNNLCNFYGLLNFQKNELCKIQYPRQKEFSYPLLKKHSQKFLDLQTNNFMNMLKLSPGFFYYDNLTHSFDSSYNFLIIDIILKRAFGENFISFDEKTYMEGIMVGNVDLIYANKSTKSFSFNMHNGKEKNNPNFAFSNHFLRINATFLSMGKKFTSNIYIFKDEFSLYYSHQNPQQYIYFYYNNNSNCEYVQIHPEIRSLISSNLQQLVNLSSTRESTLKQVFLPSNSNSNIFTNIRNNRRNRALTNNDSNDKNNTSITTTNDSLDILSRGNNQLNIDNMKIIDTLFINKRNTHKMVDNIRVREFLSQENDIDKRVSAEKKVFEKILKEFFNDKVLYVDKIQEGRLLGLFKIYNKNKLFEISQIDENNFLNAYEITSVMKINNNVQELKFYFLKKGFRLAKPLKEYEELYSIKNYFLNNNSYEAYEKEEILFPEILEEDIEIFLSQKYQNILNEEYNTEKEQDNAIEEALKISFMNGDILNEKKEVLISVYKNLFSLIKKVRVNNSEMSSKIEISQIGEYHLDLEEVNQKIVEYEKSVKELGLGIEAEKVENIYDNNCKNILGFKLMTINDMYSKVDRNCINNDVLNSLEKLKKTFKIKKLNNKIYKFDLIFNFQEKQHFTSLLFFVDISNINKIEKINNNSLFYEYKNTNNINKSNINIYLISPLDNVQIFRYKNDSRKKYIINYSQNYFSLKSFLIDKFENEEEVKETKKQDFKEKINNKEFIDKIIQSNSNEGFKSQIILLQENESIEEKEKNLALFLDVITEQYYVDKDKNIEIYDGAESKTIPFTGKATIIEPNGHLKVKTFENERLIEKFLIDKGESKDKDILYPVYLDEKTFSPIQNIISQENTDVEIKKYDPKIEEILNDRIIDRVQRLEIKPLFEDENLKMFYVEKLRLVLDTSGSMDKVLPKIRQEMKKLYKEENITEYQINDCSIYDQGEIHKTLIKCSNEGCIGESIYFVADYADIRGSEEQQNAAKDDLILKLKEKKQRLYCHSIEKEPIEKFKQITTQTGGWSYVKNLKN